ncbi:putative nucleotide-diphospho-sugar transferase [Desulfogranum marinum]|uniref:putative nucleotide-diphospho-sugar transferase n=1 Tax=Desulfogranum marinum TaxID=453220 RepID=UPI0019667C2B|nr:putative nucleotide-diphospho-sugar transferase [Desulfogranum marinum]MBM9513005.1 hypothetical protein [Desulfogranum marinum]
MNKYSGLELVYVAFGFEYLLMATHSAQTAKKHNPEITCTVVTNLPIKDGSSLYNFFDTIVCVDLENNKNRDIKTSVIDFVSKSNCAFIDCDVEILGDLLPVVKCLERYDIAAKLTSLPTRKDYEIDNHVHGSVFPQWNSGVIFFRKNNRIEHFFRDWKKFYDALGKRSDQPGFAKAIYENPDLRMLSLGCIWNTFEIDLQLLKKQKMLNECRIWHYRDPRHFPEVAIRIFGYFEEVKGAIDYKDKKVEDEIFTIYEKYKILTSFYYRNKILRSVYTFLRHLLEAMGVSFKGKLKRVRYKEGAKFKYLDR